jgi:thioredoxin reductase
MDEFASPYEVVVVGGGAAGLSAALLLGRCMRRTVVFDSGHPRNAVSRHVHGYLSRDGMDPGELLRVSREQLAKYGVEVIDAEVVDARRENGGFDVTLADGTVVHGRAMLLATGIADELPDVPGMRELYGKSVFVCPYCDGWEHQDAAIAVYASGPEAASFAASLSRFSSDLVLFTDGVETLDADDHERLDLLGISVVEDPIARLQVRGDGRLEAVVLRDKRVLRRDVVFVKEGCRLASDLGTRLGCKLTEEGVIEVALGGRTNVPGVFAAGDATPQPHLVIVAAAEGVQAAIAIDKMFRDEREAWLREAAPRRRRVAFR